MPHFFKISKFLIKKNYMDDKQKIFEEIINKTREDIFNLIDKIDQNSNNANDDIVRPLQHIIDIVIDRLLFDGFSPKIIQRILNDSLTGTVDNYANHLKNSVKEITSCSNKKNFSLRASNVKVNKKLLN